MIGEDDPIREGLSCRSEKYPAINVNGRDQCSKSMCAREGIKFVSMCLE